MAVIRIDAPFDARNEIGFSIAVEVTRPRVGAMIRVANGFPETTHRFRCGKSRVGFGADVAEQVNAAAVLRSVVCARNAVDEIL